MFKHLKVIFLHFGLQNRNRYQNMNFIHEQLNQYFTQKIQIRTSNSLQFFYNFQPLAQHSNYDF